VVQTRLEGGKVGSMVPSLAATGMGQAQSSVALVCLSWHEIRLEWFIAARQDHTREGVDAWWQIVLWNVELSSEVWIVGGHNTNRQGASSKM
jgi:hypothetical protein